MALEGHVCLGSPTCKVGSWWDCLAQVLEHVAIAIAIAFDLPLAVAIRAVLEAECLTGDGNLRKGWQSTGPT